ncbi:hypothetical protein BDF14DRAFT_1759204 [Spinellus fusiger]|nr:hypothetical protein BDF14DRAFT_1759204 [Spinellus fusiger]
MSTGVAISDECIPFYTDFKLRKKYKFIIFKLSDDNKEVVVEKKEEAGDYNSFLECLPANEPRYAVYDFDYEKPGEGLRSKITFYTWIPDTSKVRQKMLYAASKDALRKRLEGIAIEVQGTDASEVDYESVLEKAIRTN